MLTGCDQQGRTRTVLLGFRLGWFTCAALASAIYGQRTERDDSPADHQRLNAHALVQPG
jgi:hypothetical protein